MPNPITRADETSDSEFDVDQPRDTSEDGTAIVGDSITLSTYWGRIKVTVLEVADPAPRGMRLMPDMGDLLDLRAESSRAPATRALAIKLRLRNLDPGPFDRNRAVIPVPRKSVIGSDGEPAWGTPAGPSSTFGSTELPEPGQPSATGWVGFHLRAAAEPRTFVLEGVGPDSGTWRLDRRRQRTRAGEEMTRAALLEQLKRGSEAWNAWRRARPHVEINLADADLSGWDLSDIDLRGANLVRAVFSKTNLDRARFEGARLTHAGFQDGARFTHCDFSGADLRHASFARAYVSHARFVGARLDEAHFVDCRCLFTNLSRAVLASATAFHSQFWSCDLEGACFDGADLTEASLFESKIPLSSWKQARLPGATLRHSTLNGATFFNSDLSFADLSSVDLTNASIVGCDLSEVSLVGANLQGATLSQLRVYGVSAWGIKGHPATQSDLVTSRADELDLVVDDLELAQFMYLITANEKIKSAIETITSRAVLILGRFTEERLAVLRAIREALRAAGLVPILFDFEKPHNKDRTGVVETVARLARFIIADLTDPSSVPHELSTIVPFLRTTPVQPLRLIGSSGYSLYSDLEAYAWFLAVYDYRDPQALIAAVPELIARAEEKAAKLRR